MVPRGLVDRPPTIRTQSPCQAALDIASCREASVIGSGCRVEKLRGVQTFVLSGIMAMTSGLCQVLEPERRLPSREP